MEFHLASLTLQLCSLVTIIGVAASSASSLSSSPEMYWEKALPNTPMPKVIKDFLDPAGSSLLTVHKRHKDPKFTLDGCSPHLVAYEYNYAATEEQVAEYKQKYGQVFLLKNNMKPGSTVTMKWSPPTTTSAADKVTFLSREVADSIPFSSKKLPEIFTRFSINPKSEAAVIMADTIKDCEQKDHSNGAEQKLCSTSLEGMVSFSTSKMRTNNINVLSSTTVVTDGKKSSSDAAKVEFSVVGVKKIADYRSPTVACHRHRYPYVVFFCHKTRMTEAYTVSLVSSGMAVEAVAVCHGDSSWWNPKTMALQLLKVKPGTSSPVCHFLEDGNLLWVKN